MNLPREVATRFALEERLASKALGTVFTSVRMAVDTKTFSTVATAFPDVGTWLRDAPASGGRTGEMLALATPATLRRSLATLGLSEQQIDTLGHLVGRALQESLPADVYSQITARLPLLGV